MVETYIKLLGIFGIAFIIYFPFAFVNGIRKDCEEKHKELFESEQEEMKDNFICDDEDYLFCDCDCTDFCPVYGNCCACYNQCSIFCKDCIYFDENEKQDSE